MTEERFADRLSAEQFADDPVVGVYSRDPDEDSALWIPERLFARLTLAARAYELHTLPLLGGDPVTLNRPMIESLIDELDFLRARLRDELVSRWAVDIAVRASSALSQPEPVLTIEGE